MTTLRLGAAALFVLVAGCDTNGLDRHVGDLVVSLTADGVVLVTEEEYACSNVPLVVDANVDTERAEIEVKGVGEVDVCTTAIGPARVTVPLADQTDPREFEIVIEKGGAVDRYTHHCGFVECYFAPVGDPTFTRIGL